MRREDCLYETDDDYYSVVGTRDQVQTTPSEQMHIVDKKAILDMIVSIWSRHVII